MLGDDNVAKLEHMLESGNRDAGLLELVCPVGPSRGLERRDSDNAASRGQAQQREASRLIV